MWKPVVFFIACAFVACGKPAVPNIGTADPVTVAPSTAPPTGGGIQTYGTINGGGGVGIRCGARLEMLDLVEARRAGLTFRSPNSQEDAIEFVSQAIARHFWNVETIPQTEQAAIIAKEIIAPIFEGRAFMNAKTGKSEEVHFVDWLPLSNDFGKYKLPAGCALEQVAFLSDATRELSIVTSAWADLDWLSKAVLAAHEITYLIERRDGLENLLPTGAVRTSESSRRFVGRLLSSESLTPKSNAIAPKGELYRCASDISSSKSDDSATYFYAFKNAQTKRLTLVFKAILGMSSLYQLRADIEDESGLIIAVDSDRTTQLRVRVKQNNEKQKQITFFAVGAKNPSAASVQVGSTQAVTCELF